MRILWISECPWIASGFGKVTYYMTKGLKQHGYDVVIACFSTFAKLEHEGINVYPYGNPLNEFINYIEKREGKIDTIVFHGAPWIPPLNQILPYVPKTKKRTIGYFVHEFIEAPRDIKYYFKLVHLLAVPAYAIAKPLEIDRVIKVPHGVNPDIFKPRETPKYPPHVIGMVAKNHPRKLWDIWLDTITKLQSLGFDIKGLAYVFDRGYYNIYQMINGLTEYYKHKPKLIKIVPYDVFYGVPEAEEVNILSKMHIHMLITRGEGFSLPIAETLALGIPNLTISHPVLREIYEDLIIYVKPYDIYISPIEGTIHFQPDTKDLINKTIDLIEHYKEYKEKAMKASEIIRKTYTWENAVKNMIKAIDEVQKYDKTIIEEEEERITRPISLKPKVIE